MVASRTAARAFPTRNKSAVIGAPAPRWLREEPLAPKCPPTLNEVRCPGIADPVIHGQASAVLEPTPHVSGLSGDIVEIFFFGHPVHPVHPKGSAAID